MVEVEETPTAFIMKEHNCALGSVVEKYNQLCQQELSLFERLLSVPLNGNATWLRAITSAAIRFPKWATHSVRENYKLYIAPSTLQSSKDYSLTPALCESDQAPLPIVNREPSVRPENSLHQTHRRLNQP